MTGPAGSREPPDEELVRAIQSGPADDAGRAASETLLGRYAERIYLWCYRVVRSHEEALDLSQDVALEVLTSLHQYRGESRFSTWLYSVTRHRCLRARRRPSLFVDEPPDFDTLESGGRPPDREVEERLDEESLLELMRSALEPDEATALWMRCVEGATIEHITRGLGLTNASGARALLQTARRKLRAARGATGDGGR